MEVRRPAGNTVLPVIPMPFLGCGPWELVLPVFQNRMQGADGRHRSKEFIDFVNISKLGWQGNTKGGWPM